MSSRRVDEGEWMTAHHESGGRRQKSPVPGTGKSQRAGCKKGTTTRAESIEFSSQRPVHVLRFSLRIARSFERYE